MQDPLDTRPDLDQLITLLRAACEDAGLNATLERLLSQPDSIRHLLLRELLADLRARQAPPALLSALTPLLDSAVADTAWQVIFRCQR